ncbi:MULTISPECIES: GNAT family N-acetyltransferase [Pseudomonas aeruginosa group]|uniref:GNAT family N-acetyltransferase n=2 Tax=Pseudomonas aeruginosa group TaxID=136841 RepID=UPI0002B77B84|nr:MULTISPECIES: GNAT family N-acetyltransferase [Pseudomonas aeruginosa group]AWE93116.1 acetyltransferase domain protein [Pseudomonas paraeruginosa]KSC38891.1 N-acetyltransferase [Pseudomonas paraeruginosa]KSD72328.1 N-acetyltransferase [Pseudomonas aeruginosa]KSL04704.1 N-acetyltransferase [Pseudomonas aeruginosa]MBH9345194.1 GNAT family N-acetyltransferase [Pseudomonas aeruginosa]
MEGMRENPVRIRQARAEDAPALSRLAFAAKSVWGYRQAQLEAWREELHVSPEAIQARPVYLLEDAEGLAGMFALTPEPGAEWELDSLWVAPRAMRRGYGRRLLASAAEHARSAGVSSLRIDADPYAEAFYIAQGAQRYATRAAPIDGEPGRVRPQLRLGLG